MAQTLNITIKINQSGLGNVDQIIQKIKKLNESLNTGSLNPFQQAITTTNESLQKMVKSLGNIQDKITQTISTVRGQTKDIADSTGVRAIEKANKGFETMLGRAGLVVATTALVGSNLGRIEQRAQATASIFSLIRADIGQASSILGTIVTKSFGLLGDNVFKLQQAFEFLKVGVFDFGRLFSGLGGIFLQFGAGIASFTAFKFLLGEVGILFRRVVGRGTESLTILERATRLMTLFDDGLNRSFNTMGKFLKIGSAGVLTFFNPLLGAVPLINSVTDVLLTRARGVRDRISRFFGDGRASFTIIFQDLRKLLTDVLPGLIRIGERFSKLIGNLKTEQIDAIFSRILGIDAKTQGLLGKIAKFSGFNLIKSMITGIALAPIKFAKLTESVLGAPFKLLGGIKNRFDEFQKSRFTKTDLGQLVQDQSVKKAEELRTILPQINKSLELVAVNTTKIAEGFGKAAREAQRIHLPDFRKPEPVLSSGKVAPTTSGAGAALPSFARLAASPVLNIESVAQSIRQRAIPVFQELITHYGSLEKRSNQVHTSFLNLLVSGRSAEDSFRALSKSVAEFFLKTNNIQGLKIVSELNTIVDQAAKSGKIFSTSFNKTILEGLEVSLKNVPGKDIGGKISSFVASGIKQGGPEVEKAIFLLAELIASYLPQSPAKRGPLRALPRMGRGIVEQISQGIGGGVGVISSATARIAERIAGFFPRSPALFGPLVLLPAMGLGIVRQLVGGIDSGFSLISGIMDQLTRLIADPLQRIRNLAKLDFLSQRTGVGTQTISVLGAAIEQVGGNASELDFVLARVQETMSKTLTAEELAKFARLGINLDGARQSGEPALALFEEVADVIKRFGAGSAEAKQALDALGITTNSALVNVLAQGRAGLRATIGEIAQMGGVVDTATAKNARAVAVIETKLKQFKDFLFNEFIAQFLPKIREASESIFTFIKDNSLQIRAFIGVAAQFFSAGGAFVAKFALLVVKEPGKALDIFLTTIGEFFSLVGKNLGIFFNTVKESAGQFLLGLFSFLGTFLGEVFSGLSDKIGLHIAVILAKIEQKLFDFFPTLLDFLKSIPGKILDLLIFLGEKIGELLGKIVDGILGFKDEIVAAAEKIIFEVSKAVIAGIKGTALEDAIRLLGGGLLLDQIEANIKAKEKEMLAAERRAKEAEKNVLTSRQAIQHGLDSIVKFDIESPDAKLEKAEENLKKNTKNFGQIFADAADKASGELDKMKEAAAKLGDDLGKPEMWQAFKENTRESMEEITTLLANAGFKEEVDAIIQSLSPENFRQKIAELRALAAQAPAGAKENLPPDSQKPAEASLGFSFDLLTPMYTFSEAQEKIIGLGRQTADVFGNLGQVFSDIYETAGSKAKAFAKIAKGVSLGQAIINVAVGVTEAMKLPFPLSIIQAAVTAASGGVQVAKILTQGFAQGGQVFGPGGNDNILARLTAKEFVLPVPAVNYYGAGILERMRKLQVPKELFSSIQNFRSNVPSPVYKPTTSFNQGGMVLPVQQPGQGGGSGTPVEVVIVNVPSEEAARRFLHSSAGAKAVLNIMANNKTEIKRIITE